MTADHPNAVRLAGTYTALAAGDLPTVFDSAADDIVLHVPGEGRISGDYQGKEAVFGLFAQWFAETQGTFSLDLLGVLASDSHAVALHRVTAERNGKQLDMQNFAVFQIGADGRAVERWEFLEDVAAHDDFWS